MGASESSYHQKAFKHVKVGNDRKLKSLLKKRGKSTIGRARDPNGIPLLHVAVSLGRKDCVETLVYYGADTNEVDSYGLTPLHHAASNCFDDIAKVLLENGADVNARERDTNCTASCAAATRGDLRLLQVLVENSANINLAERSGMTPLHWACQLGNEPMVKYLLENNADLNVRDNSNSTPIFRAKAEKRTEIIKLLEAHLCKINNITTLPLTDSEEDVSQKEPNKPQPQLSRTRSDSQSDSSDRSESTSSEQNSAPVSPSKRKPKDSVEDKHCKVCWERSAGTVLLWCEHICVCFLCAQYLQTCPICCRPVEKVQRVYMS